MAQITFSDQTQIFFVFYMCLIFQLFILPSNAKVKNSVDMVRQFNANGGELMQEFFDEFDHFNEQDTEEFSSNEDFEFDNHSESQDLSDSHKERELTTTKAGVDLCRDVRCKTGHHCVMRSVGIALCVPKIVSGPKYLEAIPKTLYSKKQIIHKNLVKFTKSSTLNPSSTPSTITTTKKMNRYLNLAYNQEASNDHCGDCLTADHSSNSFYCGSNNEVYRSLCRIELHNCLTGEEIRAQCRGLCPCPFEHMNPHQAQQAAAKQIRMEQRMRKYIRTSNNTLSYPSFKKVDLHNEKVKRPSNQDTLSKQISFKKIDQEGQHKEIVEYQHLAKGGFTSSVPKKYSPIAKQTCDMSALLLIGERLFDWIGVVYSQHEKHRQSQKNVTSNYMDDTVRSLCDDRLAWMFERLDSDRDSLLSIRELIDLQLEQREKCLRPYMDTCDVDHNSQLDASEWCGCFDKYQPCTVQVRRLRRAYKNSTNTIGRRSRLMGAYMPQCEASGYFRQLQCNTSTGFCWCVNKEGQPISNSRKRGTVNCEEKSTKNMDGDEDAESDDEDSFDEDSEEEGSGEEDSGSI